ncbi:MAG: PqqD family peptide modification chaperone [Rhodothermales bacterium]|nr:PqqD family peptide modification chaperone [Rhodothermales bacterium]
MISLNDTLVVEPDLMMADLEGEAVLLNAQTGRYYGLNDVGTRIWTLVAEPTPVAAVVSALKDEYDVDPVLLEGDILRFVEDMVARRLVEVKKTHA